MLEDKSKKLSSYFSVLSLYLIQQDANLEKHIVIWLPSVRTQKEYSVLLLVFFIHDFDSVGEWLYMEGAGGI